LQNRSKQSLIAHHGYDVTGIDLSFKAISTAKEFEAENLTFFNMISGCHFG
jgi:2-polyprenyl-3-methyl-5-hydroxy-6-metoxy-1,4-benzoquinol methylase